MRLIFGRGRAHNRAYRLIFTIQAKVLQKEGDAVAAQFRLVSPLPYCPSGSSSLRSSCTAFWRARSVCPLRTPHSLFGDISLGHK